MDVADLCVNNLQDLEVEAEAEHQQGAGSQPRAWGMVATNTRTFTGVFTFFRCKLIRTRVFLDMEKPFLILFSGI